MATTAKQPAKAENSRTKAASGRIDSFAKLKADHAAVKKLFDQFERSKDNMSDAEKNALADQVCQELTVHAQIEEEIFYPAVREVADDELNELLDEAEVEHAGVKELIAQLEDASPKDELYDAKVTVLGEQVKHHADAEEKEMFPKVKKTDVDLQLIGEQLVARAEELKAGHSPTRKSAN